MASWKKTELLNSKVDFRAVEEMLSDLLDTFDAPELDLTKPIRLGFSVMLDYDGLPRISEFEMVNDAPSFTGAKEPLIDLIDSETEISVVIETTNLPAHEIDLKVMEGALIISSKRPRGFVKRVAFPSKVIPGGIKTTYNNNILEVKLPKAPSGKALEETPKETEKAK